PMIINSILMANTLSMAMLNRGFGYTRFWTSLKELSFTKWDYLTIIMIILMVISGIYLRFGLNKGIFT
ncbi:MAG: energy-coupling factor transport system permease protein, partial [Clostridia bacterium]|nr:energy-coupling factor transport system permease protein [Clostridia bacterium]